MKHAIAAVLFFVWWSYSSAILKTDPVYLGLTGFLFTYCIASIFVLSQSNKDLQFKIKKLQNDNDNMRKDLDDWITDRKGLRLRRTTKEAGLRVHYGE